MSATERRSVAGPSVPLSLSLLLLLLSCGSARAAWQDNLAPRRYLRLDLDDMPTFYGNHTDDGDFFRIIQKNDSFIIVGARNAAYNLSLTDLSIIRKLSWSSNASTVELCSFKAKPLRQCQNYIRVMAEKEDGSLMVCGTNAFSPWCRHYRLTADGYERESVPGLQGVGLCPYSPIHNSTSVLVDGELYVATAADFSDQDPLILRDRLRTDKWDMLVLDDPHFVKSFALGEHVYFLFRENAIEYTNCGKRVYSRVARVCRSDIGGPSRFKSVWTTYVKTRLNCSVTGDFPFYFDEIQATSDVVTSSYGGDKNLFIYGVFNTPPNGIGGSAVCAFQLQNVLDAFAGPFKERATLNSNWLPVPHGKVPEPRPGQCVNDSRELPAMTLNFIKTHPIMDEAVGAYFGGPILTRISASYRFSAVTVDPRVPTLGGEQSLVDVIFVGTDNGRLIKAFNSDEKKTSPVIIEELQVFPEGEAVTALHVSRGAGKKARLVVSSDTRITMIPLGRCYTDKITICSECVALQDPYCAWSQLRMRCLPVTSGRTPRTELVQSVTNGASPRCPQRPVTVDRLQSNRRRLEAEFGRQQPLLFQSEAGHQRLDRPPGHDRDRRPGHGADSRDPVSEASLFSAETLAVAVAVTAISALLIGFTAGHCCARRCRHEDANLPYADTDYTYFDQRQNPGTRLGPAGGAQMMSDEVTYSEPVLVPTNNMAATLKKSQQDAAVIPLQCTDGCGPPLRLTGGRPTALADLDPPPSALRGGTGLYGSVTRPTAAEELSHRIGAAGHGDPPTTADGYHTGRSIRRVYL